MYPKIVKQILMIKSTPHPRSSRTPIGGRKMAKMILQMSDPVKAMVVDLIINICLTILGYIPGIIHALYIILKY